GLAGRPNARAFALVSPTSSVVPSRLITRHPRYHAPGVPAVATGRTTARYSASSGAAPSRVRAWEIPDLLGIVVVVGSPSHRAPSTTHRSTSRVETSA